MTCACGCGQRVARMWSKGHNRRNVPPTNKRERVFNACGVGGYWWTYKPTHSRARSNGYVKVCWLVVEARLGRYLKDDEDVHHINENKTDDRFENLVVMTHADHARHHAQTRNRIDGRLV